MLCGAGSGLAVKGCLFFLLRLCLPFSNARPWVRLSLGPFPGSVLLRMPHVFGHFCRRPGTV